MEYPGPKIILMSVKMANVTTSLCEFHDLYGIESQDLGKDTTEKNTYSAY